jgi:hypothetical protein
MKIIINPDGAGAEPRTFNAETLNVSDLDYIKLPYWTAVSENCYVRISYIVETQEDAKKLHLLKSGGREIAPCRYKRKKKISKLTSERHFSDSCWSCFTDVAGNCEAKIEYSVKIFPRLKDTPQGRSIQPDISDGCANEIIGGIMSDVETWKNL